MKLDNPGYDTEAYPNGDWRDVESDPASKPRLLEFDVPVEPSEGGQSNDT